MQMLSNRQACTLSVCDRWNKTKQSLTFVNSSSAQITNTILKEEERKEKYDLCCEEEIEIIYGHSPSLLFFARCSQTGFKKVHIVVVFGRVKILEPITEWPVTLFGREEDVEGGDSSIKL